MKTQICILSALLGLAAVAAGEVNVLSFGATADGKTDCTAAFQRAIDALKPQGGKVTVPAGVYVTGELQLWPGVVVEGAGGFAFRGLPKGSTLKLRKGADARAMFNLTGAMGATLRDLALLGDVDGLPDSAPTPSKVVHGVGLFNTSHGAEEGYPLVDHCLIRGFSGDGIHLHKGFCGNVRNCLILDNRGDGIRLDGWDFFIINNEINNNWGYGFHGVDPNNACTITANRIEWNHKGGLYLDRGSHYCINANYFDRSGVAGVIFENVRFVTFTGNQIYRSARPAWDDPKDPVSAHAVLRNCKGVTFSSNSLVIGRDDYASGEFSPRNGLVVEKLENCTIMGNTAHAAFLEKFIVDRGGHTNIVCRDNMATPMKDVSEVFVVVPEK